LTELLERLGVSRPLLLDAAMGTALIERGLEPHAERAPTWSLVHPREVSAIHAANVTAGAELLLTNTFSETAPTPQEAAAAIRLARAEGPRFVAASLWADLAPAEVEKAVRALGAADAIWLETGTDMERARAAVEAACAVTAQPVVATLAFTQLASPGWEQALTALADAGAAAVGFNCAPCPPEPGALGKLARRIIHAAGVPAVLKPDAAGLAPGPWAAELAEAAEAGALLLGGCCGTGAAHLAALRGCVRAKRSAGGGRP
jgi:methionine synthase I (cobalamin-dependent)